MYHEAKKPKIPSAISGARWAPVEGLYDQPGGTVGPSISERITISTENVITMVPTSALLA